MTLTWKLLLFHVLLMWEMVKSKYRMESILREHHINPSQMQREWDPLRYGHPKFSSFLKMKNSTWSEDHNSWHLDSVFIFLVVSIAWTALQMCSGYPGSLWHKVFAFNIPLWFPPNAILCVPVLRLVSLAPHTFVSNVFSSRQFPNSEVTQSFTCMPTPLTWVNTLTFFS